MYVYKQTEPSLWTVGHYDPNNNKFIPESDHDSQDSAADRVIVLNGGSICHN